MNTHACTHTRFVVTDLTINQSINQCRQRRAERHSHKHRHTSPKKSSTHPSGRELALGPPLIQLMGLGEHAKIPSVVQGEYTAANAFLCILSLKIASSGNIYHHFYAKFPGSGFNQTYETHLGYGLAHDMHIQM